MTAPDHPIQNWSINWGDGTTDGPLSGNLTSYTHVYLNSGTYSITATATTNESGFPSNTISVTAAVQPPTVTISGSSSVNEDDTYTLNYSATGAPPGHPVTSWNISWGDGTSSLNVSPAQTSITHVYKNATLNNPPYQINATANNDQGNYPATALNVDVLLVTPTVTISGPSTVNEDSTYTLNLSHTGTVPDHPIQGWVINWGDGNTTTLQTDLSTATHVYKNATLNNPPYQITATASTDEESSLPRCRCMSPHNS